MRGHHCEVEGIVTIGIEDKKSAPGCYYEKLLYVENKLVKEELVCANC